MGGINQSYLSPFQYGYTANSVSALSAMPAQNAWTGNISTGLLPLSFAQPTTNGINTGFQDIGLMGSLAQVGQTTQLGLGGISNSVATTMAGLRSSMSGTSGLAGWAASLLQNAGTKKTSATSNTTNATATQASNTSSASTKTTSTSGAALSKLSDDKEERMKQIVEAAKRTYPDNPVMAKLVAAQAVHESGLSGKPSKLATDGNNLFGIKGKGDEGTISMKTQEEGANGKFTITDGFAKYSSLEESFKAHKKLMDNDRYKKVGTSKTFEDAAREVKAAGYATDSKYTSLLISVFDSHLSKYF